jgi:hypothetical protein
MLAHVGPDALVMLAGSVLSLLAAFLWPEGTVCPWTPDQDR